MNVYLPAVKEKVTNLLLISILNQQTHTHTQRHMINMVAPLKDLYIQLDLFDPVKTYAKVKSTPNRLCNLQIVL